MAEMSKILVTGGTGNVGSVVSTLVTRGHDVRAVLRDPGRASLPRSVEVVRGDLSSPETLTTALRDVESVYLMWPGLPVEPRLVEIIAEHAERVVYLSADVPDLVDGEQPAIFHQAIERLIRESGLNWTFVRAIDFATNTLNWAEQIDASAERYTTRSACSAMISTRRGSTGRPGRMRYTLSTSRRAVVRVSGDDRSPTHDLDAARE